MQSDIGTHFYIRQMRDMKLKPLVELVQSASHGAIRRSLRMGAGGFGDSHADQNEQDHRALVRAVQEGCLEAYIER